MQKEISIYYCNPYVSSNINVEHTETQKNNEHTLDKR